MHSVIMALSNKQGNHSTSLYLYQSNQTRIWFYILNKEPKVQYQQTW